MQSSASTSTPEVRSFWVASNPSGGFPQPDRLLVDELEAVVGHRVADAAHAPRDRRRAEDVALHFVVLADEGDAAVPGGNEFLRRRGDRRRTRRAGRTSGVGVGRVEHDDAGAVGDVGHVELAGAHAREDDAVDLAVEHGADRFGFAGGVAIRLEYEHDVVGVLSGFEGALDEAARKAGGRDDVRDEADRERLLGAKPARGDVGAVAEGLSGSEDAVVGLLREPRVGAAVEDHRRRGGGEPGEARDVSEGDALAGHRGVLSRRRAGRLDNRRERRHHAAKPI